MGRGLDCPVSLRSSSRLEENRMVVSEVVRVRVWLLEKKKKCWILLKPDLRTISHLSSYLSHLFHLSNPSHLILSMDGFVLPPFESISILKDKDLICVKTKQGTLSNSNRMICVQEEKQLVVTNELQREESDPDGDEEEHVHVHSSKKRKASTKLPTTKSKKNKCTSLDVPQVVQNDVHLSKTKTSDHIYITKTSSKRRLDIDAQEADVVHLPDESIKLPSRSARRKKAKRRWLREISNVEKKEINQHQTPEKENQQPHSMENRQSPIKNKRESSKKDTSQITQEETQSSDVDDEVFPIVVRPGHIRFEPLGKDSSVQQNQTPVETYQWNGITSKKKGQKWGMEKATYGGRSNDNDLAQEIFQMLTTEEEAPIHPVDFDKLSPYAGLPEKGDVIAYRLIELSSSWCPEVSSFRAGKISQYDPKTNKVSVEQVPEYPVVFEKSLDEEDGEVSAPQLDTSLYNDDGSLEIELSSLIDVRIVKHVNLEASNAVKQSTVNGGKVTTRDFTANGNSKEKRDVTPPVIENGAVNTWDEISEALSAKKAQLSQEEGWKERESTRKRSWSSKSLRGSALGPTMAILRAENKI